MKRKISLFALTTFVLLIIITFQTSWQISDAYQESPTHFIDSANFNFKTKPSDNFYLWANGNWIKNHPVPPTESRWGSFAEIQESNYSDLKKILEASVQYVSNPNSDEGKIGNFYLSGIDSNTINAKGYQDIKPYLNKIDNLSSPADILQFIASEHRYADELIFGFYATTDDKNSAKMLPQFYQNGLSLPEKDYYTKTDERMKKIRDAFVGYATHMFENIGESNESAKKNAQAVLEFETKLADASMSLVEQRDPNAIYHKMTVAALTKETPHISWCTVMNDMSVPNCDTILVGQPLFMKAFDKELVNTPLAVWKAYLKLHIVESYANVLSDSFVATQFAFYGTTIRGQKENKPRWKRVLQSEDDHLGELLGKIYVAQYFPAEAKERILSLVNNLQSTYATRINQLSWMSPATKKKALYKLSTFMKKIAYPDKWRDYSSVNISNNSYFENVRACDAFVYRRNIAKLGKPVDRSDWEMTPPTVNAYYNPGFNEIVFPAGILKFPFFDFKADDAINYGGIGGVIGHEMTHGFDDQGSQYDAEGNLSNWWAPQDKENFVKLTDRLVKQYDQYTVLGNLHVNGRLTLGENLADLGGITLAYTAFKKTAEGQSNEKIDGFTPDQRFFLSWAQIWRSNSTDASLALRINTDPHSPTEYRCNGPLSNLTPFYKAFDIQPNSYMWRPEADRIEIW
ncbi:MAG: M13 family metallopeptidase [Phycisphaerales bacterium]|nr:M13 family metallopeptidase [Phycisphaerales bacterium]